MTSTLVDSSVFIDLFNADGHSEWSARQLLLCMEADGVVLSPIVWAEVHQAVTSQLRLAAAINWLVPRREKLDFDIAQRAGEAHIAYRRAGGSRERTLPDFLIGAHAEVAGHKLLTRDPDRYRSYFPTVDIIAPDTHP
jgi:hypothetical protein